MKKKLTTEEDYRQRVDWVCMYIREHLDKEIDMRRLAVLSAFSPFHFHRIMRAYLKEPIGAFIIRTRVETAAKLLRYTDLPVADIAYRVGYDTPSSLTKSFCKFFGISPKMYRLTKNYQMMTTQEPKAEVKLSCAKVVEQEPKTVLYISATGDYKKVDYSAMYMRMWEEIFRGYDPAQKPKITTFANEEGMSDIVFDCGDYYSMCEHHILPFFGRYYFAYIPSPKGRILGISKVARVVGYCAARLQLQERLARDIVQMLSEALNNEALGFAIVMKGQHLCKTMRGVRNDGKMSVAHFTGVFNLNSDLRKEFYKLIDLNSNG